LKHKLNLKSSEERMNETMKARVLALNNYEYSNPGNLHVWFLNGKQVSSSLFRHIAVAEAWQHLQDNKQAQEALEAQRAQVANDLAGKEAYEEVKAEVNKVQCPECFGDGERWNLTCNMCNGDGYVIEVPDAKQDETAQLRAEIEALKAENERSENEVEKLEKELHSYLGIIKHACDLLEEGKAKEAFYRLQPHARMFFPDEPAPTAQAASEASKLLIIDNDGTEYETTVDAFIATAKEHEQAASEVPAALDKPKKPVATRMHVNWGRGFSSGSYPVLGFSQEKQVYILDISTDCNRAMPKPVRFADCLEA
jgi:uncharacterized protein (UPF0212 family)